ncbi:MAG: protein translocase subunit SecF [Epsilonproteobacteria bacterium]|nr:protein translocase subunit SecF [Campylobacterota bacterium]
MEFFRSSKTYDFMGKSKLFIVFSVFLIIVSWALVIVKGLNYGIDFAGGTLVQVKYTQTAPVEVIRNAVTKVPEYSSATVTEFGSPEEVIIKIPTSSSSVGSDIGDEVKVLLEGSGDFEIRRVDMVGPKVGSELREKGLMAMGLSIIAILIYIAFRFEWRFGVASIFALVHDVSIALGMIALFAVDVNLDILAALLTIMGYSLNDTIIVFDRIREGIRDSKIFDLFKIINVSVTKTLSRTTLTSLTTFFVVLTLFLFGGEIINGFSFTMLVGIVVGTYSSIFIASPFLKWLGFDVEGYKLNEARKEKLRKEKEKMRAQFEGGVV